MNTKFHLDLSDVFTYVDSRREEFLGRLVDYLRRPSISAHGLGIADVAEYIAAVMRGMNLETQIIPTAGWPMVFGQLTGKPGAPTILLYGHYDGRSAARAIGRMDYSTFRAGCAQWTTLR